ncbi:disintegrin and metalloproteinase domain-containing protein 19 [Ceratina calcarata]|uniref:Disintegrin and metalloproteinase domain-containing protein 19 n=1 Tax=Ceratina calcarata TaxID=156304 RepID=A0AAJ7JD12_9HYME|nr:disintegrin and metalloproteinase domain-containing protein 19 [Ceratina calcarata]
MSDTWCSNPRSAVVGVTARCKLVLLVLVLLAILPDVYTETYGPSPDFSKHTLVRPRVYHARSKRQISSTKENDLDHADVLTVAFELDGQKRVLDLRLNTDLIPVGYQQRHQHQGTYKVHTPSKVELCHYQGSVRDVPGSWVAVSTCKGLRGVVFDGENLHHIHPGGETLDSDHYVYEHADLVANHTCGYEGTPHHVHGYGHRGNRATRHKRAAEVVRGPYNANRQSRYVELVFVIDKKEYIALDENLDKVYQHCKDIANIINALYMPLNIFVALVGVQVWSDTDEITLSTNGDTTLSNFLRYRKDKLVQDMPNDNAQLLTRITFDGGVVGKALKGPICTWEFSGGVSMDHSNVVGLVAATVAHEMGHNFGMEHDSADCECPEEKCIMSSSSGSSGPTHWSTCSLEHLALAFEHGMDYCLRNKPQKLFDSPICGNGFVEPGEQCDCGLKEHCDNPCCNVTTCMLHSNASCATGACCDLKTCRPKTAGTECRSADHECDLPEYCTGQSEYCPVDVFKMDGESCNMGKAFCYQGSCRTHNDQCKLLWGPTGTSSDTPCYEMNNKGTKQGNCGFNRVADSYFKCTDENLLCGMLHCRHQNERLEFGMESVSILSHSFINNGGKIIPCRSAIVDLGLNEVDPGLAPDGAKCAPGKMCVNQKCMPVADLRASVSGGRACPNDCGGNGVCNSLGHCHCNRGFRPPDCTLPGVGGSEDSGPAEDPNARNDFIMALYIIFLGIVPMIALSSFGVWYMRNSGQHWKKGMMSTSDRGHNGLSIKTIDRSSPLPRNIETIDSSLSQDPACASLLPKPDTDERYNNNLFGQFKGFTITPIKAKSPEPSKPAPPPPTIPTVAIKTNIKPIPKSNPSRSSLLGSGSSFNEIDAPPTLPPLNPGCTSRPLISSPVLAATTCTSVELVAPKVKPVIDGPTRPAPAPPISDVQKQPRPNSTPLTNVLLPEPERKPDKGNTLNRIASMLRPNSGIMKGGLQISHKDDKTNTNSLPRTHHLKANKVIDKEILRNLEISNPIPQKEIEIPTPAIPVVPVVDTERKNVVLRAQSMRDSKITPRPAVQTFGSMRQTSSVKRPTSIPASTRPTAPPPEPPTSATMINETVKIPGLPGYQNPQVKSAAKLVENTYDDCMNLVSESSLSKITEESPTNDNIYAVIEETLPEKKKNAEPEKRIDNEYKLPKRVEAPPNPGGLDSMGLLSEIVSEISNRNFDSIYSTSTLFRKPQKNEEAAKNAEYLSSGSSMGAYVNSAHYKSPDSIYSNSASGKFNSSSSTTSSGYLNPSALNVPQQEPDKPDAKPFNKSKPLTLSSTNPNVNDEISKELGMKPSESIATRKPVAPAKNRPIVKTEEKESKEPLKPPLGRTKTPPNITKSRQTSDASKSKQNSENNLKGSRQNSLDRQSSSDNGNGQDEQDTNVNRLSLKTVPCNTKDNGGKFNSPDLVSSCSNANQISTKSPDVVGNPKVGFQPKNVQKTATITRTSVTRSSPTTPTKPLSIASKIIAEKKKSPTGNASVTKSLSAKETTPKSSQPKLGQKTETKSAEPAKTNTVQRAASGKSNVASLQQKFEANRNVNATRTVPSVHKKTVGGKANEAATTTGLKK